MKAIFSAIISLITICFLFVPNAFSGSCNSTSPPSGSNPGGGSPDDTFAVDSGFISQNNTIFNSDPNAITFQNGYFKELSSFFNVYRKSEVGTDEASTALDMLSATPLLVIPTGGLHGMENSTFFKATLDEFVKNGGTLIVFDQQHGYEYSILPTPDGNPITAYGWDEDQNCFANALTINTWHQMFSGLSRSTPTVNVDGYFTSYPSSATVLMSRTANGQPALIMYDYGLGKVIATTMYSDWAFAHGQASPEETALVRDMITWAKKPDQLPEIKPGEIASFMMTVTNSTDTDAASVKLLVYTPDRKYMLEELPANIAVPAGQSAEAGAYYWSKNDNPLGIYHVDYVLLDAQGNMIQPQAETDSGRFIISNPPQVGTVNKDIWLTITSPDQQVFYGEPFVYTFHVFNNTDTARNLTIKTLLPHTGRTHEWNIAAAANGETTLTGSDLFLDTRWMFETLRAYLYDENGTQISSYMLSFKGLYPSVNVATKTDKTLYAKGETVNLSVTLQNKQSAPYAANLQIKVIDPTNNLAFNQSLSVNIDAGGTSVQALSFPLSASAQGGVYTISTEALDPSGTKIGADYTSFELPLTQISVTPMLPSAFSGGVNTVSFNVSNIGKLDVNSGVFDLNLKDPDGNIIYSNNQSFAAGVGQNLILNFPVSISSLKFGNYTLTYTVSDETRTGKPTAITIINTVNISLFFDKSSYRVRDVANLTNSLANTGKFNLDNITVTLSVPDAGYSDTKTMSLSANSNVQTLNYSLSLPATMSTGQHVATVTLTLPGGSGTTKSFTFSIPQSSLTASLSQTNYTAGDVIDPVVGNNGGVDTVAQYTFQLYDSRAALVATSTNSVTIPAGSSIPLSFSIPAGSMGGNYNLVMTYTDQNINNTQSAKVPMIIVGIRADSAVQTDKQVYLSTESITGLSTLTNLGTALQNGNLHLQITSAGGDQIAKTWSSQYDFQQGTRNGTDTFETLDSVTLVRYSDDFDDGILDTDRWSLSPAPNGPLPSEQDGVLLLTYPRSPGGWNGTYATTRAGLTGDFDATVDYKVLSPWQSSSNNHPAGFLVSTGNWWARIDIWASSPTYGSIDSYNSYTNAGGASTTGKFRIRRVGSTYYMYYWKGSSWTNMINYGGRPTGPATLQLMNFGPYGLNNVQYDNFVVSTHTYPSSGTMNLKYDAGRSEIWDKLSFNADIPTGTSIKFRTRTADTESGLSTATWSSYIASSGSPITSPKSRWIEIETTLSTANTAVTPTLSDITVTQGHKAGDILWQTDTPVDLAQNETSNLSNVIGTLNTSGKLYLQGTLTSSTGQTVANADYPFYVVQGNTVLLLDTDKKTYRPGEMVTITGQVQNLASVTASALNFQLAVNGQNIYTDTFDVPANSSYPFTLTTTADSEGTYPIAGTVTQNNTVLVGTTDQFEVASPVVTATVSAPDVVGNEAFLTTAQINNNGKVPAVVNIQSSSDGQTQTISLQAGETKIVQYNNQITADTTYLYTFTGDLNQIITKTVAYGLSAAIQINAQAVYPEGKAAVPVTLTNPGLLDENLMVSFNLSPSSQTMIKTYFVPRGGNVTDTLYFDVTEGSYQLTATSQLPSASGQASFSVRKQNEITMSMTAGAQSNGLMPVTINLTNLGSNSIDGSTKLSVIDSRGITVWNTAQDTSLPYAVSPSPTTLNFSVNTSAIQPGSYTIKGEFFDNSGQQLAVQTLPLSIQGAAIQITQLPSYQTFSPGQQATFTFTLRNTGAREGAYELNFKAYDLIDSTQKDWIKSGEEKTVTFSFVMPMDLDENDYYADYRFQPSIGNEQSAVREGQIKYHLSGIKLDVNASLDKQYYSDGDTVHLTISVNEISGGSQNLFARVNYAGYESQQSFTSVEGQTQDLQFDVPLTQITGEKLFYGIYQESGRSLHLNSLYIYKVGDAITVMTDKQVYNPSETVTVTVTSVNGETGTMTLTGPGDYSETFAFPGSVTKTFVLSDTMTAGTYTVNAELDTGQPQGGSSTSAITASHPFDVAGIQVKVKEATLDKPKYAPSDTMNLSLLVESNRTMPATLRTWVVDPGKNYTQVGESAINLSSSSPVQLTNSYPLTTVLSGIHRLVYGIYYGDLLLVSGSVAFDVGDAVLSGLSTDKTDYSTGSEPVITRVAMYGTVDADLELQIDGTTVKTVPVSLNGFTSMDIELNDVKPGTHGLTGILTAGGLKSTKDTSFAYGSSLPDLTVLFRGQNTEVASDNTTSVTINVFNQGKTPSEATTVALYDGDTLIETKPVDALDQGESKEVAFVWSVLGKAGDHTLKAVVDPDDNVVEFNEDNNTATLQITIQDITFNMTTDKDVYNIGDDANVAATVTNLSAQTTLDSLILDTEVTNGLTAVVFTSQEPISAIQPVSSVSLNTTWNTTGLSEGDYAITQTVLSGSQSLSQKSKLVTLKNAADFEISTDTSYQKVNQGANATYVAHLKPVYGFISMVEMSILGLPSGTSSAFNPASLVPPGDTTTLVITTEGTPPGSYDLTLSAEGGGKRHEVPLTLDVAGFALGVYPSAQSIKQLETATYSLELTSLNSYSGGITLSVEGASKGLRVALGETEPSVPGEVTLTVQTSKYTKPGIYTLTAVATDGLVEKREDITLTVEANPDIAVGIITTPGPGPQNPALVSLFTKDLNLIRQFTAFDTKYGANAVMGDVDGDGYDEIIVAPGPDPKADAKIRIFKRDGTLLNEFNIFDTKYGVTLAAGNLDGDWKDEIVVGMGPDPKNPSRVRVLKYDSGGLIETGIDFVPFDTLKYGVNVALGDVDGDGSPEMIVGAGPDPKNPSRIRTFKIDTASGLGNWKISSTESDFVIDSNLYGANVTSGDVNGDSTSEIVVGAGPDPKNGATVKILNGDGTSAGEFSAYDDKHPYGVNVCSADFDDAGVAWIITGLGSGPQNQSRLRIFDGNGFMLNELLVYQNLNYGLRVSTGRTGR
jgi:hypothetical protein